ncbi:hypothetical protein [Taylorella equigenitalis]|uniref:hypothetical protein n=1 Tax=Taylorella equigenitalis TaxID=29575 RepID=UPI000AABDA17
MKNRHPQIRCLRDPRIDALNNEVGYRYDVLGRLSNLIKTVRSDGKEVDYLRYGSGHLHGMLHRHSTNSDECRTRGGVGGTI